MISETERLILKADVSGNSESKVISPSIGLEKRVGTSSDRDTNKLNSSNTPRSSKGII
jgi:hypothetical protein